MPRKKKYSVAQKQLVVKQAKKRRNRRINRGQGLFGK